jgi:hypothetical protein
MIGIGISIPMMPPFVGNALDLNFLSGSLDPRIAFTRASNGWEFNSEGNLAQYSTNVSRFGYDQSTLAARGLLMEMARTNIALHSRDFTQTAWVKSNITAALNVTGIDGVANSASRLTATAANGTALQTITSASANHVTSFFVRRISGTGTVEITQNNGTTWTAITLTSAWQRFVVPVGTVANPVIGLRLVTSGDVVAVDVAQAEVETFPTSPIITAGASVTRAVDIGTMASVTPWFNAAQGTMFAEFLVPFFPTYNGAVVTQELFRLDDGSSNNWMILRLVRESASVYCDASAASQGAFLFDGVNYSFSANQVLKLAMSYDAASFATSFNGSAVSTGTIPLPTGINRALLNSPTNSGAAYLRRIAYYPTRLSNAALQGLTA